MGGSFIRFGPVVVAVVMGLAACGDASLDELRALPEVGLQPAGSQVIAHHENPAERTIDSTVPATVGDIFASTLAPAEVLDFYDAELAGRGYTHDAASLYGVRTTAEDEVRAYIKGHVIARIAIVRAGDPRTPDLPAGFEDGTMFELAFIAPDE